MSKQKELVLDAGVSSLVSDSFVDFAKSSRVRDDRSEFSPSLTQQEFKDECDINKLMERYEATGIISHVNRASPQYMDFTDLPDLREALDVMRDATVAFNSLPARVRKEFDNDAQKFVDFAQDPANVDQMVDWGLAAKRPDPVIPVVRLETPPEPKAPPEPPKAK